ncbi:hypothetical protein ACKC9G_18440 [Pokkaliibacter sp. CJK22405]|uniref:hypothetical protein n=1 Tax=Pokkaliibacter sp. CJK22405 TaxID=3384615 RepID=UPI003985512B
MANTVHKTALVITGDSTGGTRAIRRTREELMGLDTASAKTTRGMQQLARETDVSTGIILRAGSAYARLAAGAGTVTAAVGLMATKFRVEAITEAVNLSDAIGMNVQTLLQWQYAADKVGVNADKMGDIFKDTTDKVNDFIANGGGEAGDLFKTLNLNIEDFKNLSPDQLLLKLGQAVTKLPKGQQVTFMEMLADDGSRLLPLLRDNAALLEKFKAEAVGLGVAISPEDAASIKDYEQSMKRLVGVYDGLFNRISGSGARLMTQPINDFVDAMQPGGEVAENWDSALIALTGVISSRLLPALSESLKGRVADFQASRQQAAAELNLARAENSRAQDALRLAAIDQTAAKRNLEAARTAAQRSAAITQLAQANAALIVSEERAAAGAAGLATATRNASLMARGLQGALSLVGGPAGALILGVTAFATYISTLETAADRTEKLKKETTGLREQLASLSLFQLNDKSYGIADQIRAVDQQITEVQEKIKRLKSQGADDEVIASVGITGDLAELKKQKELLKATSGYISTQIDQVMQKNATRLFMSGAVTDDGDTVTAKGINSGKASSKGFLTKADSDLIDKFKPRADQLKASITQLEEALKKLGDSDPEKAKQISAAIGEAKNQLTSLNAKAAKATGDIGKGLGEMLTGFNALREQYDPLSAAQDRRIQQEKELGVLLAKNKISSTDYADAMQYLANQSSALVRGDSLFKALQDQRTANRYTGPDATATSQIASQNLTKQLTEGAPTVQGLSPQTGGAFSEANQLDEQFDKYKKWYNDRIEQLREFENTRYGVSSEAAAARHQLEQEYAEKKTAYEKSSQVATLQGYSQLYGTMGDLVGAFAGTQSKTYRAMLITQKAYTLASVLFSSKEAIAAAWASAKFPYNLGAVFQTIAGTGAIEAAVGAISTSFAGAYDNGGNIPAGKWGIMAERGTELLNGVPVMGPAEITGRTRTSDILSKVASNGSGSGATITYAPVFQMTVSPSSGNQATDQKQAEKLSKMIDERTRASFNKFVVEAKRPGGLLSNA